MSSDLRDVELKKRKEQGRAYLRSNQIDKALRIYARILQDNPEDLDSLLILGDSYFVSGERDAARSLYRQAYQLAPGRKDIERRIALVKNRGKDTPIDTDLLPTNTAAISSLLQKLTGRATPIREGEVLQAETLLTEFLHSPSPGEAVAKNLDQIDSLLPALVELNIRQAKAEGRMDLVEVLEGLMGNILIQMDSISEGDEKNEDIPLASYPEGSIRVLVAGVDSQQNPFRKSLIAKEIQKLGYDVSVDRDGSSYDWNSYQLVIAHNPHGNQQLVKGLAIRAGAGLPNILDFDINFRSLPETHPDQHQLGLKQEKNARNYSIVLQLSSHIIVPCKTVADEFDNLGYVAQVIPEAWDENNALWNKPDPARPTINMGLIVIPGMMEDVAQIRRPIVRIVREFQQVRLVINGDPAIFQYFDSIPEVRRLFLPPADAEDYPYLLTQMDMLLVPLVINEFNRQQTDRRMLDAGVREIPWIGSPSPAAMEWGSGGLVANTQEEWYSQIKMLTMDANLRKGLGKAGKQKAQQRTVKTISRAWLAVIHEILKQQKTKIL